MSSKRRELQKQIEKYEEAIEGYQNIIKHLENEQSNPTITLSQRNVNEFRIAQWKQYVKVYQSKINRLRHEMAYPPKEPVQVYDHVWEQVLSGEPVKAGRLV